MIAQTTIKHFLISILAPKLQTKRGAYNRDEELWFQGAEQIRSLPVAGRQTKMEEVAMKRAIILSAAILLAVGASAMGAERPGASSISPGHEMQNSTSSSTKGDVDSKTTKGASEYSPGDRMHDKSTTGMSKSKSKGASEYSPGDRMNDRK